MLRRVSRGWSSIARPLPRSRDLLDRFSDHLWYGVVKHVPNVRNQPQDAVRNLRVKPGRLLGTDDTILGAGHNDNWDCQFLIAVSHREGTRNDGDAVLTLRASFRPNIHMIHP
jgi:hypothetical protein